MNEATLLCICRANVGRSQIAEGFYRNYHDDRVMSIAGAEAKKEKYHDRPLPAIVDFLRKVSAIDIASQRISYLSDIPTHMLGSIRSVYFLYDTRIEIDCDTAYTLWGMSPYDYFQNLGIDIMITPIEDPFDIGPAEYERIIEKIHTLITSHSGFISSSRQRSSK